MKLPVKYGLLNSRERKKVREEYIKLQNGNCQFCGNLLTGEPTKEIIDKKLNLNLFPVNFLKWPVHLHHDHCKDLTIGAVHAYCNGVLWQYYNE